MNLLNVRNAVSVLAAFSIALAGVAFALARNNQSEAAAVTVSITSPANAEFPELTATDVTFSFAAGAEYAIGEAITVVVSPALAGALVDCTAPTTSVGGGAGSFGSFTTSGAVYTFSGASTTATTAASLCLRFPASTTQGSYSISITDNSSANNFGAALVYAGDDNDVLVSAVVGPTLSFNIRDLADSADTNVCYMGSVDTTSQPNGDVTIDAGEGECGYSLAIATNATNGFTATIEEQGDFQNSDPYAIPDQAEDTAFVAGTEGYGLAFVDAGTALDGEGVTEAGDYATDTTPVPAAAETIISSTGAVTYVAGTDATDVTAVVHGLTVAAGTPTGVYSHTVTYYVTASF